MPSQTRRTEKPAPGRPLAATVTSSRRKVPAETPVGDGSSAEDSAVDSRPSEKPVGAARASKSSKEAKGAKAVSKEDKPAKPRKALVRDSFTMPVADFSLIEELKGRAMSVGRAAKKSELLRAGLQSLAGLDPKKLKAVLDKLDPIKVGRPRHRT